MHRSTVDVVCDAVTGTLSQPQEIVAGLPTGGDLRIVGRTAPLTVRVARWRRCYAGPWGSIPGRRASRLGRSADSTPGRRR